MYEIPEGKRTTKGRALVNYLGVGADEKITSIVPVTQKEEKTGFLFFATKEGVIKKVKVAEFDNIRKSGIVAMNLDSKDELISTFLVKEKESVFMVSRGGKSIRFDESDIRPLSRTAKGVIGMKLTANDTVITALAISQTNKEAGIMTIGEKGFGKQTKASEFKAQSRGGSGIIAMDVTDKTGQVIGAHLVTDPESELITMSKKGQMVRLSVKDVPVRNRQTQGVTIMKLKDDDEIVSTTQI